MMESEKTGCPVKVREHWHHLLDSTVWNEFQFREDDIIIDAYSKSGTTWVQQIVIEQYEQMAGEQLGGFQREKTLNIAKLLAKMEPSPTFV